MEGFAAFLASRVSGAGASAGAGAANDLTILKDLRKIEAKGLALRCEFERCSIIATADNHKRKFAAVDDAKKHKARKEPYATESEVVEANATLDKFRDALYEVRKQGDALVRLRNKWGYRQMLRSSSKTSRKRHCGHCAGKKAKCSCSEGCPIAEDSAATCFTHCEHCSGRTSPCTCKSGCTAVASSRLLKCRVIKPASPPSASPSSAKPKDDKAEKKEEDDPATSFSF